tara:strand:+ start:523 stop:741 length:219 start_codon:yes stop_codon:yes gene_type:complete
MIPRWNNEVYPVVSSLDGFQNSAIEAICSTYNDAKRYKAKLESREALQGLEFKILMFNLIECGEIVDSKILE